MYKQGREVLLNFLSINMLKIHAISIIDISINFFRSKKASYCEGLTLKIHLIQIQSVIGMDGRRQLNCNRTNQMVCLLKIVEVAAIAQILKFLNNQRLVAIHLGFYQVVTRYERLNSRLLSYIILYSQSFLTYMTKKSTDNVAFVLCFINFYNEPQI